LLAMAGIKQLCRAAYSNTLEEQLDLEAMLMVQAQGTDESKEGIAAFLEKRPADYVKLRK
ncbi:MAG: enoyl-CoA hydratase-related protein, partial [Comamonas sp.]